MAQIQQNKLQTNNIANFWPKTNCNRKFARIEMWQQRDSNVFQENLFPILAKRYSIHFFSADLHSLVTQSHHRHTQTLWNP